MKRLSRLLLLIILALGIVSFTHTSDLANLDPDIGKSIIDAHVHVAGLGYGNSGAFVGERLRHNFRFPFFLRAMGISEAKLEEHGDRILFDKLSNRIFASKTVDKAVVLALDGYVTKRGDFDRAKTVLYVPNEFVAREAARFDNLLFGASINPNRKDAVERLRQAHRNGAVLVKWIPSIMNIDPSDTRHIPFYQALAALGIPLLCHAGMEKSFPGTTDELADPLLLRLPLEQGVTVIVSHIATTGRSEGQENFERILPMFKVYPNLYADISSLTQINKLGYLARALEMEELSDRLVYGSDWPLQFFPVVSPWFHINHISLGDAWQVSGIRNQWDRDVALKVAFGVPDAVFRRSAELLKTK